MIRRRSRIRSREAASAFDTPSVNQPRAGRSRCGALSLRWLDSPRRALERSHAFQDWQFFLHPLPFLGAFLGVNRRAWVGVEGEDVVAHLFGDRAVGIRREARQ